MDSLIDFFYCLVTKFLPFPREYTLLMDGEWIFLLCRSVLVFIFDLLRYSSAFRYDRFRCGFVVLVESVSRPGVPMTLWWPAVALIAPILPFASFAVLFGMERDVPVQFRQRTRRADVALAPLPRHGGAASSRSLRAASHGV